MISRVKFSGSHIKVTSFDEGLLTSVRWSYGITSIERSKVSIVSQGRQRFVSRDHFRLGGTISSRKNAGSKQGVIRIADMDKNFRDQFLPIVENDVPSRLIVSDTVVNTAEHVVIMGHMDMFWDNWHKFPMCHLWNLLDMHASGEDLMLEDGFPNVIYSEDVEGNVWAIFIDDHHLGWRISARPIYDRSARKYQLPLNGSRIFTLEPSCS